ncbi:hypothetical protein JCM5353_005122 [Sporobolomyces roseus]
MSATSDRPRRWRRPNFWLGKIIPSLLVWFGYSGYRLVLLEVYPLIRSYNHLLSLAYISWVNCFLALVTISYSLVYFHSQSRSKALAVPEEVQEKLVIERDVQMQKVFACDERGEPLTCSQDSCQSSYLSIRTRHCRDCGICQPGFDHHCSFMDNCISTSSTFKPFLQFIFYAILLLSVALVPLAPLQLRAFKEVIAITWGTKEMSEDWWRRWWSWAGGPVWRYAGGLVLGYIRYPALAQDRPFLVPGHRVQTFVKDGITYAYDESNWPSLASPTLSTLSIVVFATLIDLIGLGMLLATYLNVRKGQSSVQVERARRYHRQQLDSITSPSNSPEYDARLRLWIPLPETKEGGAIVLVEPDAPLFDFGTRENWKLLMGKKWWEWFGKLLRFAQTCLWISII